MATSVAAAPVEQPGATAPVVGVDLGGTKIAAALVAADGALLGPVLEAPTPAREGPRAVLDAVASLVAGVVAAGARTAPGALPAPTAVGIGSAGVIDSDRGVVVSATDAIADWPGTDIASAVTGRLLAAGTAPQGVPVHIDNDVNAYAAGEA